MKIAIIVHRLTFKGGTQRQSLALAQELKKQGHHVKLYAFEYDPVHTYTDFLHGLEIISLPRYDPHQQEKFWWFFKRPSYLSWWYKRNRAARRLAHLIDRDTDILNPHAFWVYAVSRYFKKEIKNIPCVWMLNTVTLRMWKFWRAQQLDPHFHLSFFKRIFYQLMDIVELKKFIQPHQIVVLNTVNKQYVRDWMKKDAVVVRTGADLAKFHYRERSPPQVGKANILLSGVLYEHRRFEDVIEAVRILADKGYDLHVSLVGNTKNRPAYYQKLVHLTEELGLENRVRFLGVVSESALQDAYRENDIGVFPSTFHPGNLAMLEVMACGMPVIVSRGAALHEILTDRENALLVNPYAPHEVAASIQQLIDVPALYTALSRNGRKFIEEHISWSKYAAAMLCVFERELARHKK